MPDPSDSTTHAATEEQIQATFTEWNRRYREEPEGFMRCLDPEDYGKHATRCFLNILAQVQRA